MALFLLLFLCSLRSAAVESTAHGLLANGSNGSKYSGWHMGKDTTQSPCYFMRSGSVPNSIEQELLEKMKGFELLDIACKENEAHLPIIAIAISSTGFPVKLKILVPTKNTFHEFVKVDRDPKGNGMIVTGYSIEVFKEVMDSLPYRVSYEFYPYENGRSNDMGYYNDLIQQLHVNRYDGVVGDITITSKRSKYGDFTLPYMMSGVSMIVPVADGHTKSLWWFLKPFTLKLWLLIIALFLSKGILVWIFEHKNNLEFRGTLPEQIGKTLSFSFSIFVFAQKETLKSNYSRLIVNLWIFVVFLFVTSYASILQSMLTSNNDQPIVTSIEQLIRNGDYVGYQKESFVYDLLKQMGFQEQKLKSYSSIEEYEIALSRGSHTNGVSAIIDEIPYVKLFLAKYANRYMMVGPTINPSGFGFLFHRGCAIVHDVSRAILNFTEGERGHELEKKWFGSQEPNPSPTQIRYRDIRLSTYDFRGVLLITESISGISLLIFIIVTIFRHWQTTRDASSNGAIVGEGFISPAKKTVPMTPSSKDHDSSSTARRHRGDKEQDLCDSENDTFSIPLPKKATIEQLKKWRQATLVFNASRRFRYTLDLKKVEEKDEIIRKIRAHTQVVRAALLFKEAGEKHFDVTPKGLPPAPSGDYRIGTDQLTTITRDHDFTALQQYGGVKGLASLLKTELEKGIAGEDSELVHRRSVFGANNYPRKKGRSFWVFLWESWQDLTLIILMVAAAVSLASGMKTEGIKEGWYDGGSIAFAVLLVIVVTAFSDYRQSLQFQSLNEEKRNILLEVVRGGRRVHISIFDIVVGDVIPLKIGDQVPADGILISGHCLAIDESSMTGESKIVHKDTKSPFLMSGCKVADGYGDMLVTAVGLNTEWGLLMASISEDTGEETPLQVRLNGVATFIGVVGLTIAAFVLVVLLARYFTGHTTNADGTTQFVIGKTGVSATIDGAVKIVTIAVTIVVVAVPEGLPLAVTLTLAYSMRKMMADKALVRRLSACETMGSATTICSDKTGTLTLNQMTIVEAYVGGKKLASPDSIQLLSSDVSSLLIEGIAQNTTGNVFVPEDGGAVEITGSPTEKAILSWGVKLGMIFGDIKSRSTVLHVFPFNSEKKHGGVALQVGESEVHIHWKGAAEIVLSSCTRWLDTDGLVKPMDQDKMNKFEKVIEDMAAGSLRCVAFAYRLYGMENLPIDEEQRDMWELPEDELVLMAIVGIKDPCRPGVKDAVQLCTHAGVKVRMVTGDNIQTAKAIALECGILDSEAAAVYPTLIEGRTFRALPDNQREEVAEKISVMGRSSPNDKLLLVKALRNRGHVVGVTGDGTNDAPALHEADIGLAMGIQGTEVAKESADIIILDDNFASVVKVVRWGRSVYANIQKFIQFQLTVNVVALIINVVAAVSSGNVPLNAVQLLWVNLIMDTLGALALATEPPTDHLMLRPPVSRSEPLITNVMWRNIIVQALYQVIVLLVLNFGGKSILHLKQDTSYHADKVKNTLIFNSFVICQVFNEFNARKPDELNIFSGMTRNHLFMGIIGVTVLLQVLIIEFLGKFAKTVRLSWKLWLVSIAIGVISWPIALIGKLIPVPENTFQ